MNPVEAEVGPCEVGVPRASDGASLATVRMKCRIEGSLPVLAGGLGQKVELRDAQEHPR